jgi:sec-independent protein translocase protein TatC
MTSNNEQAEAPLQEQPFVSHLVELRDRLLRAVVAVVVVFVCLFPFANDIYQFVSRPLLEKLPQGQEMIATGVISPFLAPFKLSLVMAIFVAMPYILYQFWAFVAPGLYKHEKKVLMPMVGSSALLFYAGAAFAYFVVFPLVFSFMVATTPEGVNMAPDITQYLEFVLTLFFAFGIAFEVPIATIILVWMGLTTPDKLAEKRPFVIVGAFCIGMLLTPPDVISQTLLAIPMWILFEFGVFFSRAVAKDKAARAEQASEDSDDSEEEGDDKTPATTAATASGSVGAAQAAPVVDEEVIPGFPGDPSPEKGADGIDQSRYKVMSEEELDDELDEIEAEFDAMENEDLVEEKLRAVNRLREEGDVTGARTLLYEILSEGNEDQARVARNILAQLDE